MLKRGQVSVFAIIGIVAVLAIILVFFLFRSFQEKAREIANPKEYLSSQLVDIKRMVSGCVDDNSRLQIQKLYENGGHVNPVRYADYYGKKITVLCYKVKNDEPCYNMMFNNEDIDRELRSELGKGVKDCIKSGLDGFRDGEYEIDTEDFSIGDIVFEGKTLLVSIDYPITLTKGIFTVKESSFKSVIKTNFWDVAQLASSIVNMEALGAGVDLVEINSKNNYYEVGRTLVDNGVVYMIVPRNEGGNIFYFAVEK